jgi:hypothetical protein
MTELATAFRDTGLVQFDPSKVAGNQSLASAGIEHAKRIEDWEMLEEAVAFMIAEQREFVRWWKATVRDAHRPKETVAELGQLISCEHAQESTGIKKQQVSRWRNSLKDEAKYRGVLFGPSYKKAMAGAPLLCGLVAGVILFVPACGRCRHTARPRDWRSGPPRRWHWLQLARG